MSVLSANKLAKWYGAQHVLQDISFDIPPGAKIGLVGPNGSGKTTLLRLMVGLEDPSAGTLQRAKDARIGYLPQHADFSSQDSLWEAMQQVFSDVLDQKRHLRRLEAAMAQPDASPDVMQRYGAAQESFERAGGYAYEYRIRQVLGGLGFDQASFDMPVAHLSGGQRTRALLARLLLEESDLLLLDEPTNHLDLAGIEWLEKYLKNWQGAMIIVAHDRAFLDALVDQVWEVAWRRCEVYRGNYSAFLAQKAERQARQQAVYERQQAEIERTEEFIRRNIAGQRTKEAQGRRTRLARMERVARPETYQPLSLDLGQAQHSADVVMGLRDLRVGYAPEPPLVAADDLTIRRGECVALLGPNGAGKTTLLRTILGEVAPLAGRVEFGTGVQMGYFAQEHAHLDPQKTVLETIVSSGSLGEPQARTLLARYRFTGDDVFKRVADLSGGERARVALAVLTLQGANFLVLDEPTNHLDLPSQEVLQDALDAFEGSLLLVSHDRYLIRNLASAIWAIDDGGVRAFPMGYDDYQAWLLQRDVRQRPVDTSAKDDYRQAKKAQRVAEREKKRRAQRQADLEEEIHRLEHQQADLEQQLAEASAQQAVERVAALGHEYKEVQVQLEALLATWTDVAA